MELTFVRHAQPSWVIDGKSVLDPQLTDLGQRQASQLALQARAWPTPTRILVSSAQRARQTARPLCEALGVEPEILPWLQEIRFPESMDGADAAQVGQILRNAPSRTVKDWYDGIPGGECYDAFHARVCGNLDALLESFGLRPHAELPMYEGPEQREVRLWFVAHGGTNAVAAGHLLRVEPVPWAWERFVTHHTGVTRIRGRTLLGGQLFGLVSHSDVGHLSREERSR